METLNFTVQFTIALTIPTRWPVTDRTSLMHYNDFNDFIRPGNIKTVFCQKTSRNIEGPL